jgi:hypothetical protein
MTNDYQDNAYETEKAGAVLKGLMYDAAKSGLDAMADLEQIDKSCQIRYMQRVTKALSDIELDEEDGVEVAKALPYGPLTTDLAALEDGSALVAESVDRKVKNLSIAKGLEIVKSVAAELEKGWRPWDTNVHVDTDGALAAFKSHMQQAFYADEEEAEDLAEAVMRELASRVAGRV